MILPKRSLQFLLPAVLLLSACGSDDDPRPQPQPQPGTDVVAAPMVLQDIKVNTVLEDRNTDPAKPDYLVNSNIRVMAELTVKPGVVIAFEQDTRLDLNTDGKIIAVGTADKKIRFIGKSAQKGFWAGITIYSNSSANQFAYAEFLHAGSKAMLDATKTTIALFETARVSVTNSTISESGGYGIYFRENSIPVNFANNHFSHNQEAPLLLSANHVPVLDEASVFTNNNGRDVVEVKGSLISGTTEAEWPAFTDGTPIRILGTINVRTGWKLKPGTTIEMAEDKLINIESNGYLNAVGTAAKPIIFTGVVQSSGSWNGIVVYTRSTLNVLDHARIRYAGGKAILGGKKAAIALFGTSATSLIVQHSEISNSGGYGIHVFGNKADLNADVETSNVFTANTLANVFYEN